MKKQNRIIALSLTLITVFIISLFSWYQSANIEQNVLKLTHNIHSLRIDNLLIKEQTGSDLKRQNYDNLNNLMDKFTSNWQILNKEIKENFSDQKQIIEQINTLDDTIHKERFLYLHYESEKAILANSVFFLVNTESELRHKNDKNSLYFSDMMSNLLKDITYYNVGMNEIKESIDNILSFLDTHKLPDDVEVKVLKKHIEIFYEKSMEIQNTTQKISDLNIAGHLTTLEKLFFQVVSHERASREFINIVVAVFTLIMLLGFLVVFFKTYKDKEKILQLQSDNDKKHQEILEHMQLLSEYKKALDVSSIVSKTDLHGIITYVNNKFCEISGYTREELIGRSHNIVRHPEMPKETFALLWKTIKDKKIFNAIIKNRMKNGGYYYVDSTIIPIFNVDGEVIEYFGVRHDVTELIKAKEEALAAEKAKSAFLATMSHELRTPLNAVIGFSQILLAKEDFPKEMLKSYLDKIHISGKHLLNIVNNILDFSKIESQKMELNKTTFELENFIEKTLLLVETSAKNKNITITKSGFTDVAVSADEQLLKQVVLNILSNAVKFTPENKSITLSYEVREQMHCIDICDEGIGLTQEQIEKIFDPFSQVKEHQNEAIKGTGLGLAISQKIMEMHNGKIEVTSQLEQGSCFYIFLPLTKEHK